MKIEKNVTKILFPRCCHWISFQVSWCFSCLQFCVASKKPPCISNHALSISSCAVLMSRSQPKIWRKIQKIGGDNIASIAPFSHVCVAFGRLMNINSTSLWTCLKDISNSKVLKGRKKQTQKNYSPHLLGRSYKIMRTSEDWSKCNTKCTKSIHNIFTHKNCRCAYLTYALR